MLPSDIKERHMITCFLLCLMFLVIPELFAICIHRTFYAITEEIDLV